MALLGVSLVISIGVASYVFNFEFYSPESFGFIGIFLILSGILSLFLSYRFSAPIGFVIQKALQIAQSSSLAEQRGLSSTSDVYRIEQGEFSELERALEIIRKKLKERRVALAIQQEGHQTLTDSIDEALVTVDQRLSVQSWNSIFLSSFGYEFPQGISGLQLQEIIRDPRLQDGFSEALKTGASQSLTILLACKSGEKYFRVKTSPLINQKNKKIYGALGVLYDIHDLKIAAKVRTDFIENASHELKTPLTAMKGSVSILNEEAIKLNDPLIKQLSNSIQKSVDRMIGLVGDLLTLSSFENRTDIEFKEVNLAELTQDVLKSVEFWREQFGHKIDVNFEVSSVIGNYNSLFQLLQNLMLNAMKYSEPNKTIRVRWFTDDNSVNLAVSDQGFGISKEHLPRLFERFYRVDRGRSRDVGGSGLGLAIVKHITQLHGGKVTVQSELGSGSEFICQFPKMSV